MSSQRSTPDTIPYDVDVEEIGSSPVKKRARNNVKKSDVINRLSCKLQEASDTRIRKLADVLTSEKFKIKAVDMNEDGKYATPILTIETDEEICRVWGNNMFKRFLKDEEVQSIMNAKNFSYLEVEIGAQRVDGTLTKIAITDYKC